MIELKRQMFAAADKIVLVNRIRRQEMNKKNQENKINSICDGIKGNIKMTIDWINWNHQVSEIKRRKCHKEEGHLEDFADFGSVVGAIIF